MKKLNKKPRYKDASLDSVDGILPLLVAAQATSKVKVAKKVGRREWNAKKEEIDYRSLDSRRRFFNSYGALTSVF